MNKASPKTTTTTAATAGRGQPRLLYGVTYSGVMLNCMITLIPFIMFNKFWLLLLAVPLHFVLRHFDRQNPWWLEDLQARLQRERLDRLKAETKKGLEPQDKTGWGQWKENLGWVIILIAIAAACIYILRNYIIVGGGEI